MSHLKVNTVASNESDIRNYYEKSEILDLCDDYYQCSYDAIAIIDFSGNVIFVNDSFERLYGWSEYEMIGRFIPTIPRHYKTNFQLLLDEVLNGEVIERKKELLKTKGFHYIPVDYTILPIVLNEMYACLFITKDLSEQAELESEIRLQKSVLKQEDRELISMLKNVNEAICLHNLCTNKPIFISQYIEKTWGFHGKDLYENPKKILRILKEEDVKKFIRFFTSRSSVKRQMELEIEFEEKSFWVRIEITPIVEDGVVNKHISIFKDITELKNHSNKIKELDQLGVIGQLAAGIAHEVKNPLTSIKGFIQLLAEETNSEYADIITSEIDRIEFIMSEFLILAKPKKALQVKEENIQALLNEVYSFMTPEAMLNDIILNNEFEEVLPVYCEPKQIKQVIINLVKNGIEAMPNGGEILIKGYADYNHVVIEVIDEGNGMCQEELKRLKEPFYSSKEKGNGLGVMICYKIIEDHKGTIDYFSEEGKGTKVQITLPYGESFH